MNYDIAFIGELKVAEQYKMVVDTVLKVLHLIRALHIAPVLALDPAESDKVLAASISSM